MRFKDKRGEEWTLALDMAEVMRIKRELGVEILDFADGFLPVFAEVTKTVDLLWLLCGAQASQRGIDVEAFVRRLDDVVIAEAASAFLDAYIDFFRSPTRRARLEAYRAALRTFQREIGERVHRRLDEAIERSGRSPSDAPASPGSTQDRAPSPNSS